MVFFNILSIHQPASQSSAHSYPSNRLNRAGNYSTMFDTTLLPYNRQYNGCNNTFCYTQSKGTFIYKPHTGYGMVGRSSAGYLAQRRRL